VAQYFDDAAIITPALEQNAGNEALIVTNIFLMDHWHRLTWASESPVCFMIRENKCKHFFRKVLDHHSSSR